MLFCVKFGNSDKYSDTECLSSCFCEKNSENDQVLVIKCQKVSLLISIEEMVKSPYNWFILPLTQPQVANQQQQQKNYYKNIVV